MRKALGKDFSIVRARDVAVLARGSLHCDTTSSTVGNRLHRVEWQGEQDRLLLLITHLPADIFKTRDPYLKRVIEQIRKQKPDLVVGDFNAPMTARRLARLPSGYAHAYHQVGSGWSATYPAAFPFLSIDQCITGPRITPLRFQNHWTLASNHRMQILDFRIRSDY